MRGFAGFWNPAYAGCGFGHRRGADSHEQSQEHGRWGGYAAYQWGGGFGEGGQFGVRRPLRFLQFKLGLREEQVASLARILDDLKTERAQAAVDDRRVLAAFADAVGGASFDQARADEAVKQRQASTERVAAAVAQALPRIHGLLDDEQRERFSYLIRTGAITL